MFCDQTLIPSDSNLTGWDGREYLSLGRMRRGWNTAMSIGARYAPFGVHCCLLRGDYYFFLLYQTTIATRPETCRQNRSRRHPYALPEELCPIARSIEPDVELLGSDQVCHCSYDTQPLILKIGHGWDPGCRYTALDLKGGPKDSS